MRFIKRMLGKMIDYAGDNPIITIVILVVFMILLTIVATLLGVETSGGESFPLIIFM